MNLLTVRRYARGPRRASLRDVLLGVDVGGTFTDAVLALEDGRLVTAKAPSTPRDQSEGVMAAVHAALERAGREAGEVRAFAHGMTVATNALLEGKGARTALVPPERRLAARECTGPDGVLRELEGLDELVAAV